MDDILSKLPKPPTTPEGPTKEDFTKLQSSVADIARLVEEFKTQLTVIGTDMDKVKTELMELRGQINGLTEKVNGFDERIGGLTRKVDETNLALDQALESLKEFKDATNAALGRKVEAGAVHTKPLTIKALLQVWYGTPFGGTLGGNTISNLGSAPPGRNFGGGVGDTFRLRRGELILQGEIHPKVDYRVMFDVAKIAGVNTTSSTFTTPAGTSTAITGVTSNASTNILQDLWIGYKLFPRWRVEVGQQKTGLTEEGTRSSSALLTIERSIGNGLPVAAGRLGDIRDTGVMLKYEGAIAKGHLGIFDDNGQTQNALDNDRNKFFDYSAYYSGIRHLTLGVWGGTTIGDARPKVTRDRFGFTAIWQSGPHFLEAEAGYTRDSAAGGPKTTGTGGYVLYAHNLSRKWQLVGRYDEWDPAVHGGTVGGVALPVSHHNLREYTIGFNYYLRAHNAKIQVNYIIEDTQGNGYNFFGLRRSLLITNFQISY
jgi:hypothetical protein